MPESAADMSSALPVPLLRKCAAWWRGGFSNWPIGYTITSADGRELPAESGQIRTKSYSRLQWVVMLVEINLSG